MDKLASGQDLSNPFDDTFLHWHVCQNCDTRYICCLPTCDGTILDSQLCPDCEESIGEFWW